MDTFLQESAGIRTQWIHFTQAAAALGRAIQTYLTSILPPLHFSHCHLSVNPCSLFKSMRWHSITVELLVIPGFTNVQWTSSIRLNRYSSARPDPGSAECVLMLLLMHWWVSGSSFQNLQLAELAKTCNWQCWSKPASGRVGQNLHLAELTECCECAFWRCLQASAVVCLDCMVLAECIQQFLSYSMHTCIVSSSSSLLCPATVISCDSVCLDPVHTPILLFIHSFCYLRLLSANY
jgi:hypothetical protein